MTETRTMMLEQQGLWHLQTFRTLLRLRQEECEARSASSSSSSGSDEEDDEGETASSASSSSMSGGGDVHRCLEGLFNSYESDDVEVRLGRGLPEEASPRLTE